MNFVEDSLEIDALRKTQPDLAVRIERIRAEANEMMDHIFQVLLKKFTSGFFGFFMLIILALGVLNVLGIIGGILALKRKRWGWALGLSICGAFGSGVLGILAVVFIGISKDEFQPKNSVPRY